MTNKWQKVPASTKIANCCINAAQASQKIYVETPQVTRLLVYPRRQVNRNKIRKPGKLPTVQSMNTTRD